jgi:hypothetical protein
MIRTLAILCVALAAATISAGEDGGTGKPFPGGIADAKLKTLYVQAPAGGIEAVDLTSGKTQWSTEGFAEPLALTGNKLLVQAHEKGKANAVRILTLDVGEKGKQVGKSDLIEFPEWVSVGTTHGRSFSSRVVKVADGKLFLSWQARAWYAGGARPTPEIEKAARKEAGGVVEIDLASGKVAKTEKPLEQPSDVLPKELQDVKSAQYFTGTSWETRPLVVGTKIAVLESSPVKGANQVETLTLQTFDKATGKADKAVELMQGKALWKMLGSDHRYLFVHQALVKEQLPPGDYAWWVFSLETGKQVAKIGFEPGAIALQFTEGKVFTVTEETKFAGGPAGGKRTRVLKVFDAGTGQLAWEHTIYAPPVLPPLP